MEQGATHRCLQFPDYCADEQGRIYRRRHARLRVLKPSISNSGYEIVHLSRDKVVYTVNLHRQVYEAFHGPIPADRVIDHIDCDRQNNSIGNLRSVTPLVNRYNAMPRIVVEANILNCKYYRYNVETRRITSDWINHVTVSPAAAIAELPNFATMMRVHRNRFVKNLIDAGL